MTTEELAAVEAAEAISDQCVMAVIAGHSPPHANKIRSFMNPAIRAAAAAERDACAKLCDRSEQMARDDGHAVTAMMMKAMASDIRARKANP